MLVKLVRLSSRERDHGVPATWLVPVRARHRNILPIPGSTHGGSVDGVDSKEWWLVTTHAFTKLDLGVERARVRAGARPRLPPDNAKVDFHGVTTWIVRALQWEGVRFTDVYTQCVVPLSQPQPTRHS